MKTSDKVINLLARLTFFGFFLAGIIFLIFFSDKISLILFFFGSFIASYLLHLVMKSRNIQYEHTYWLLINLALLFNVLGEIRVYYSGLIYYDKILHFLIGILISAILSSYFSKNLKPSKEMVFFATLGMLTIWEIYEYFLFAVFNYPSVGVLSNGVWVQSPYDDTMFDLIFGSIGSLFYLLIKSRKEK